MKNLDKIFEKFSNNKNEIVILLSGVGSGSKLFQSYLDGHSQILMTPSHILMYLIPHWKEWNKKECSLEELINNTFKFHPSLFNSLFDKSVSSGVKNLGEKKKYNFSINKVKFKKTMCYILRNKEINFKNFFLALHIAFCYCNSENPNKKKILFYHLHDERFLIDFLKTFQNAKVKVISMIRELKGNIIKRVNNSQNLPNYHYLNKVDAMLLERKSYSNTIWAHHINLDFLRKIPSIKTKVIKHEDLIKRRTLLLKSVCKFFKIKYEKNLEKSTLNKKKWNFDVYKIKTVRGVAKHILEFKRSDYFFYEIFLIDYLNYDYNRKYQYKFYINFKKNIFTFLISLFIILLPSKIELSNFIRSFSLNFFYNYLKSLNFVFNKKKIKLYENSAFYFHKWQHKYEIFKIDNYILKKLKRKKNIFWIATYFFKKIISLILNPLFVIFEYLKRIQNCYGIFIRIILNRRYYPSKI